MSEARKRAVEAYLRNGSICGAARELGKDPATIREHVRNAGINKPVAAGEVEYVEPERVPRGRRTWILTCAQNNTRIHENFWENLLALRDNLGATLLVSRVLYNHQAFTRDQDEGIWYDPKIAAFESSRPLEIAPGLVWNAGVNILPTAVRPLSGFNNYNGTKSSVFPHVKVSMESVANGKFEPAKFLWTTGTATQRNYVQRKAGQKASFHHSYGALLVEVDAGGQFWCRQINAHDDGSFQDLDLAVAGGKVSTGAPVEVIVWGDIHAARIDDDVLREAWRAGGMLDVLRPRVQVFHDLFDCRARNHHDRGNCHREFQKWTLGHDDVEKEIRAAGRFLDWAFRPWCQSVVVYSNHDAALERWLREADYRQDPQNALFFLRAQLAVYEALARGEPLHLLEWALGRPARFLRADESYTAAGIELGAHGHLGPNGTRGSAAALSKGGHKAVIGHSHSATILDGLYSVGTSSQLDLGYNAGPSSWSHSHCLIYPRGKRAIITMSAGRWRA